MLSKDCAVADEYNLPKNTLRFAYTIELNFRIKKNISVEKLENKVHLIFRKRDNLDATCFR